MSDIKFVENFISDCIEGDIVSPNEMCNKALKRVEEISSVLNSHNVLRAELKNLTSVLRHFGHESVKRKRRKKVQIINTNTSLVDLDQEFINQIIDICFFVDNTEGSVTPRKIMDGVGDLEASSEVYVAIKWLCENGILKKNQDRSLEKGDLWNDRPTKDLKTGTG